MTEVLEKSVTKADQQDWKSGIWPHTYTLMSGDYPGIVALPPVLDVRWSWWNDRVLRSTIYHEPLWASAIVKATTKQATLGFYVDDTKKDPRRIRQAQELLLHANGGTGWVPFVEQQVSDFLTTDNGQHFEIVRASGAAGSRIIGLVHLSSTRCRRTGDPQYPIVYTDLLGREHALKDYQVKSFAHMPRSDDAYFGVGRCPARLAYDTIYTLAAMKTYFKEKISGSRALSLELVRGVRDEQIRSATAQATATQADKGFIIYKGIILIPVLGDIALEHVSIPFAGVPDGFDPEQQINHAKLVYANLIGMPVQDIAPLSGQGLGTGTQTVVQSEDAESYGQAAWRKAFQHVLDTDVLPNPTTFHWSNPNDVRDQKAKAEVGKLRAETRKLQIEAGEINPQQSLQMAADAKDVPQEFIQQDKTGIGQLSDTEKMPEGAIAASQLTEGDLAPRAEPSPLRQAVMRAIAQQRQGATVATKEAPPEVQQLIARMRAQIDLVTAQLLAGSITLDQWERRMGARLETGHLAAYEEAVPTEELTDRDLASVDRAVEEQRAYLAGFRQAIAEGALSPAQVQARAAMYAESVKASYWRGATRGLALPAWPGDGTTQCLTNCRCSWEIVTLSDDAGDYDCYWRMNADEHCQTCQERAGQWAPYRIRGGEVQL